MGILSSLAGWKGRALIAAACLALGFTSGWTARDWKQGRADADAIQVQIKTRDRIIQRERQQSDVTADVERNASEQLVQIRTVTQTIIKEVPIYVSAEADVRFTLPVGLVRVHDAAAAGDPLPEPAGEPDGPAGFLEPSTVRPSRLATVIAANYGVCHEDQARLAGLQDWIRKQQALAFAR